MGRYILRFAGKGTLPDADKARIRSVPGVTVVDSSPRMLLVEGSEEAVQQLKQSMPGWTISAERSIPLPDPRPKVRSE